MRYIATKEFQKINVTSGTIQNASYNVVEVSNKAEAGSGILLLPMNSFTFSGQSLYVRCLEGGGAAVNVVSFAVDSGGNSIGGGGVSSVDDSQISTDEEIGDLLDDIFGEGGVSSVDDSQTSADEQIDNLLDDIFG